MPVFWVVDNPRRIKYRKTPDCPSRFLLTWWRIWWRCGGGKEKGHRLKPMTCGFHGAPNGNRTRVSALKAGSRVGMLRLSGITRTDYQGLCGLLRMIRTTFTMFPSKFGGALVAHLVALGGIRDGV